MVVAFCLYKKFPFSSNKIQGYYFLVRMLSEGGYRERPKNIRCFTKRSVTIVRAGVQLISNRLSKARCGVLFSHSAPIYPR